MRYSSKTLQGNWFESRFSPSQPCYDTPEDRDRRRGDSALVWLGSNGLPKPLNSINRFKKWNTAGVVPNDGFPPAYATTKDATPNLKSV